MVRRSGRIGLQDSIKKGVKMYRELEFREIMRDGRVEHEEIIEDNQEVVIADIQERVDFLSGDRKMKILIVEDNEECDLKIIKYNLTNVLSMDRVEMRHCVNYQQFSRLEDKEVDVAIVDLKLSEDGDEYEGMRVVHDLNVFCPSCQVVILSSHLNDRIELERACGLDVRCFQVLGKGNDWRKLPKVVLDGFCLSMQERFCQERKKILEEKEKAELERNFLAEKLNQNILTRSIAAGLIHDLKGPVTGIGGYGDLLKEELESGFRDREKNLQLLIEKKIGLDDYFLFEKEQIKTCKENIGDLFFDYKKSLDELKRRFDIGMDYHRPKNENVVLLGDTVKRMLDFLCKTNKVSYEFNINEDCFLMICGDDLRMIEENAVCNSIQSMIEKRGISLSNVVKVNILNNEESVLMEIEDNGVGLPDYKMDKLFSGGITTKKNGSGLGLMTINRILKYYSATMHLEDIAGGGARMTIWFPKQVNSKNE